MDYYYDYSLVVLSIFLAIMASFASLSLASRIGHIGDKKIYLWITGGAIAMGLGIWSMHFIGMLAFHLSIELVYDTKLTLISVFIAIASSGVALLVRKFLSATKVVLYLSSIAFGLGISAMHYTGMAAIMVQPAIRYNPYIVAISIAIAISTSFFALRFIFYKNVPGTIFYKNNFIAAIIMGIAIAGMHYTAMEAAYFAPDSICTYKPGDLRGDILALSITVLTIFILTLTIIPLVFEVKLSEKNALMVYHLQEHNRTLEKKAEEMAHSMTETIRKMAERDRTLAAIIEQTNEAIITIDADLRITSWNNSAKNIYGYTEEEVLGEKIKRIIVEYNKEALPKDFVEHKSEILDIRVHRKKDGERLYVIVNKSERYDDENRSNGSILIIRDVSEFYETQKRLILWGAAYRNSSDGILITDRHNHIISANQSFSSITGFSEDEVLGKTPAMLSSGRHDSDFYKGLWRELNSNGFWMGEIWNRRKSGEIFPERLSIKAIKDENNELMNYVAIFQDIAQEKKKEEEIHNLAYFDQLTKLPNRILMNDRLRQALTHANRIGRKAGIMFLDLDRFKNVNDVLGHFAGDQLLIETARRLEGCVRADDTVCRQGGDEFILILQEVNSNDDLAHIAKKLIEAIETEYHIEKEAISISTSIGISIYPDDGMEANDLIKRADMALYAAKSSGRNQYQFYTQEMNKHINEKMKIENDLSKAIHENALEIVFQPQVELDSEKIVGVEALIRWNHPQLGEIDTGKFISIAEETGLILELDRWMIVEMCRKIVDWNNRYSGLGEIRFSINLSGAEIGNKQFLKTVAAALSEYKIAKHAIEFEITETTLMQDMVHSQDVLSQLSLMGVSIAIDDFGTGYSSLSYLKTLPIDTLKIDKSFIKNIEKEPNERKITEAIINLARTMEIEIIAEGVETKAQAQFLLGAGCKIVQGYYYYPPLAESDFLDLVVKQKETA